MGLDRPAVCADMGVTLCYGIKFNHSQEGILFQVPLMGDTSVACVPKSLTALVRCEKYSVNNTVVWVLLQQVT